jgi:hypothetical protein
MLSHALFHKHGLLVSSWPPFIPLSYPRPFAFSSGSLSGAPFDASLCELLLLKKLMMPARLPSGLVEKTLDRRLVPSAFNLTGYITSEGRPARRKVAHQPLEAHRLPIPLRMEPTNVSRTTNAIALFPLNGNPTVLRCRHPWLRLVCSVGWRSFPVKPHSLLWDQLLKTRIAIRSVSVSIWMAVGMGAIDARLVSQAGRGRHVVKMQRGGGYR